MANANGVIYNVPRSGTSSQKEGNLRDLTYERPSTTMDYAILEAVLGPDI